jgi:hypothetical protein
MRNNMLATLWMLVGAFAALWIGVIPLAMIRDFLRHFVGDRSPLLAIPYLLFTLPIAAYGATWFKRLFYAGKLPGYRPEK